MYAISSARYANPDHSAAIIMTEEAGAVLVSALDTPDDWAEMLASCVPAPYEPPAPLIPAACTKLGLKRALSEIGLWTAVKTALAADADMQEEWDLCVEVQRADPLTQAMIAMLGLSEAQVDALLLRAHELTA